MNEQKNPRSAKSIILSALIFAAAWVLGNYATRFLDAAPGTFFDWSVPFRLITLFAGLFLVSALLRWFFSRWTPKSNRGRTVFTLANSTLRYVIGLVALMWTLVILGVDVTALLAGAGVVALIIGFGAESLIADVITGIFMIFEHQYEVGDIIVVGDFRGTVTQIGIRTTSITDTGGNVQIINNSDIRNIINRSNDNSFAVCDIAVPYQGWLRKAEGVLEDVLPKLPGQYPDLFPSAPRYRGVQQMDVQHNAVFLRISAEVAEKNIYSAQRTLNRALLLAFEEAGIPNPASLVSLSRE